MTPRPAPLAVVQAGAGQYGRSWAELVARAPGFRLAALVDGRPPTRAWARGELAVPAYRTLGAALSHVECDVVLLATPPLTHRALAEAALAAGKHVLVEKPLAATMADAEAIVAAAAAAGRVAMVAQNYRFRRQARTLRDLVRGRALGRLHGARIACRRDLRDAWVSPRDWRGRMQHPYLLDMAIHHVDLLRSITGSEVAEVDARSMPAPDGPFRHDPTVSAVMTLSCGATVGYEGTWAAVGRETSWNGEWELVGTRARATWTGVAADALQGTVVLERYGTAPARVAGDRLPALDRLGVLRELRGAVLEGRAPECSAADNLRSLAVVLALARSTGERRPVRLEELLA